VPPTSNSASLNDHTGTVYVYTTRVFSAFFRKGQVIETFRGEGIYQPAVDLAIEKLRAGAWVHVAFISFRFSSTRALTQIPYLFVQIHLFGEGKVCQSDTYKADPQTGIARLQRFRWGMCVKKISPFMQQQPYIFFFPFFFLARLQWPYFDGDAPPADDHTYVDHWYV
jgi:hypothetical protein